VLGKTVPVDAHFPRATPFLGCDRAPARQTPRPRSKTPASMNRLHELNTRQTEASDLASSLHDVLDAAMELQGADLGIVQLYDEATETLKMVAHRGFDQELVDRLETVKANGDWAGSRALQAGGRIVIEDVLTQAAYGRRRATVAAIGYRGAQATPLLDRNSGKPIGIPSTLFRAPRTDPLRRCCV